MFAKIVEKTRYPRIILWNLRNDRIDLIYVGMLGFKMPCSNALSKNSLVHYSTVIKELLGTLPQGSKHLLPLSEN